jgi:hypothetical protein
VFQGEREMAADNKALGQFDLVGIPPAPRGVPQIEVTFDIDANGIVNVSAKDKGTGKEQQIRIQASGGLSDNDIEKMVKDAEAHAEEDKKRKALVEARNHGEALVHSTEKSLGEYGSRLSAADKSAIETAISDLKSALTGEDVEAIKSRTNTLNQSAMKLGEAMYQSSQGGDAGGPEGGPKNDDVVDADFFWSSSLTSSKSASTTSSFFGPGPSAPPSPPWLDWYIASPSFMATWLSVLVRDLIVSTSSPASADLRSEIAVSIADLSAAESRVPYSESDFSVEWMSASPWLRASTSAFRFLSSSA